MKYLILALAIMFVACKANAQIVKNKTLNGNQYLHIDESNVSLTTAGDSSMVYNIELNKAGAVYYDVQLSLDSVSGTPDYTLDLKGKVFVGDSWSDLETDVNWTGTSSDTTVLFQEHSTAVFMRYIQVVVTGSAGTGAATFDQLDFKIWE